MKKKLYKRKEKNKHFIEQTTACKNKQKLEINIEVMLNKTYVDTV